MDIPLRRSAALASAALKLAAFGLLVLAAAHADDVILDTLRLDLTPATEPILHRCIMLAIATYILLMAIPFCPGIEIGLGMMMLFGADIVPLVYASTVLALLLAFAAGRLLPPRAVIDGLGALRLRRTQDMLLRLEAMDPEQRLSLLQCGESGRFLRMLVRHRYAALALALNTPGNIVLGDGGGIALAAGFSRLFSLPAFALTVVLAVSPVPLVVMLHGH